MSDRLALARAARKAGPRKPRQTTFCDSDGITRRIPTPLKAIRAKCMDCNFSSAEIKKCPCEDCALWPYRFGHRPRPDDLVLFEA